MADLVRAAGLLIYRKVNNINEYLMLQASYQPYHWTPPKGHVEENEDEWKAALRETYEESGIAEASLDIHKKFCHVMNYEAHKKPKRVTYWLARLKEVKSNDVKLSMEHQKSCWVNVHEALTIVKYPEIEKMLLEAEEFINTKL